MYCGTNRYINSYIILTDIHIYFPISYVKAAVHSLPSLLRLDCGVSGPVVRPLPCLVFVGLAGHGGVDREMLRSLQRVREVRGVLVKNDSLTFSCMDLR